jgi:hypothetical protein
MRQAAKLPRQRASGTSSQEGFLASSVLGHRVDQRRLARLDTAAAKSLLMHLPTRVSSIERTTLAYTKTSRPRRYRSGPTR